MPVGRQSPAVSARLNQLKAQWDQEAREDQIRREQQAQHERAVREQAARIAREKQQRALSLQNDIEHRTKRVMSRLEQEREERRLDNARKAEIARRAVVDQKERERRFANQLEQNVVDKSAQAESLHKSVMQERAERAREQVLAAFEGHDRAKQQQEAKGARLERSLMVVDERHKIAMRKIEATTLQRQMEAQAKRRQIDAQVEQMKEERRKREALYEESVELSIAIGAARRDHNRKYRHL